jgi:hypothetical protein
MLRERQQNRGLILENLTLNERTMYTEPLKKSIGIADLVQTEK